MSRSFHFPAALLALASCLGGCVGNAAPSARATVATVRLAAQRGDWETLYSLLPEANRQTESLESFRARMQAERTEAEALSQRISAAGEQRGPVVEVPLESGDTISVSEATEGWALTTTGFGDSTALTPQDALRAFRRALLVRNLNGMLALLSERVRGAMLAELDSLAEALRDAQIRNPTSRSLEVPLSDGRTVRLTREGPYWRVQGIRGSLDALSRPGP